MKLYALDADVQTYCHHAHTQLHTPHCLLVVSGKKYSHLHPKGIALLAVADGFVFIFYSLYHTVSQHSPFSHRLLILIQRELSGLHNRIFSFFPFLFSFCSPHRTLLSHPLTSLSILHSSPSKLSFLTKGAPRLSQTGVEKGSAEINKFHPRGSRRFCPPPHSFGPLKSDPDPPQEACKTVKTNLQKVVLLLSSACLKQDLLLMDSPLPTRTVSVVDLAKLRAHAVLYSTLVTKCNSVFFSGSIVDSGRALHHQYAQLPTPYFKSKISPERK